MSALGIEAGEAGSIEGKQSAYLAIRLSRIATTTTVVIVSRHVGYEFAGAMQEKAGVERREEAEMGWQEMAGGEGTAWHVNKALRLNQHVTGFIPANASDPSRGQLQLLRSSFLLQTRIGLPQMALPYTFPTE